MCRKHASIREAAQLALKARTAGVCVREPKSTHLPTHSTGKQAALLTRSWVLHNNGRITGMVLCGRGGGEGLCARVKLAQDSTSTEPIIAPSSPHSTPRSRCWRQAGEDESHIWAELEKKRKIELLAGAQLRPH